MHSLRSAAVQYTNYGTGGAFELPTQNGTFYKKKIYIYICGALRLTRCKGLLYMDRQTI